MRDESARISEEDLPELQDRAAQRSRAGDLQGRPAQAAPGLKPGLKALDCNVKFGIISRFPAAR